MKARALIRSKNYNEAMMIDPTRGWRAKVPRRFYPCLLAGALAAASATEVAAQVNTTCSGSPTANCTDVPAGGIRYQSGVSTVNVGDGVAGSTVINSGTVGIELSRTGVQGADTPEAAFETMLFDTDDDVDTDDVSVVTRDGSEPYKVEDNFILDKGGDPKTFSIGDTTYTGFELAKFLMTTASDAGAAISGSLTINNNTGGVGASFSTTNAPGIVASSTGGRGGNGGCYTILFLYTWCDNGSGGGGAGSVVVNSNSEIIVNGLSQLGKHGVMATSLGGDGGNGGGFVGLVSDAGAGGNGGIGSDVFVTLGLASHITTRGDKSHGVFAESRGGNGGSGGDVDAAFALGSAGGNGGNAGNVTVDNDGWIETFGWNSHGIFAKSVGAGAGSGSDAGGAYAEGGNGGGESSGAKVIVNNSGSITTHLSDSFDILAQSIGGGGGDGGGAGGWFTVGGRAGSGGGSDKVTVYDSGILQTFGDRSSAIFAQSVGGGGGNGGSAVAISSAVSIAVGGAGGLGGDGHEVEVTADGSDIDTTGNLAHGIHAQSIGGGGGNGGLAVSGTLPGATALSFSMALGGSGGEGGNAGDKVEVIAASGTTIDTTGASAYGLSAQSIGGGGGNGGTAFAGAGGAISLAVGIGGTGGKGGAGNHVVANNYGAITTGGDSSVGMAAQSLGGGGGNGGFSGTLAIGSVSVSVGVGGSGGLGGQAGQVDVNNYGTIKTGSGEGGDNAIGIFAQSIGGGGGNGGSALSGSAGILSVSTAVGGGGGIGNDGGLVNVLNEGHIGTTGANATGIFAQSVGGGGGNGGSATGGAIAGGVAVAVAVGGGGGTGGDGKKVTVTNASTGGIQTTGTNSDGVFAQSIGGGGGSGGSATSATLAFPIEIEGVEIPAIAVNVAVGGRGGGGGTAGEVDIDNFGAVETSGFLANGVFAQSVGGSGGRGGNATNVQIAYDATFSGTVAIGGSGGKGGVGSAVTMDNSGLISTGGDWSAGVFAQSVGGGGGLGGNATTVALSLTPPPTSPEDFIPSPSMSFDLAIGGNGGTGAVGGAVTVNNLAGGSIATTGNFAAGIMAQSVGGAGGAGGDARIIQVDLSADPMDFISLLDLMSLDMTLVFGGTGGTGSHGGVVNVINDSSVTTSGAFSHGIVAQSVGGGGGTGGSAASFQFSNTELPVDIPVLDDIAGLTTIEMTLQGSGGAGGDGKDVTLINTGNIHTSGAFAMGIVAQSVAGGGGLAGFFNPQGVVNNTIAQSAFNTFIDTEVGLSFAGSVGGGGTAGHVTVNHTGNIQTLGDGAHAVFAQSAAGTGAAGQVDVTVNGLINASGAGACGIYAQSGGGGGNGNIAVTIDGGSVTGGSGSGAGACFKGGASNTLTNKGLMASADGLPGMAIVGGTGNESVNNYGTVTGSLSLGTGANALTNHVGGVLNTGPVLNLGPGNLLTNAGTLSPGGVRIAQTTSLTGDLTQSTGELALDLSLAGKPGDRMNVTGRAQVAGGLRLNLMDAGYVVSGTQQRVVLAASDGATDEGLTLAVPTSSIVQYALVYPSANEIAVSTRVNFAVPNLGGNAQQVGEYLNAIQATGGSEALAPYVANLLSLPNDAGVAAAYDKLGPGVLGNVASQSTTASLAFNDAMHSCRQRAGDDRFIREGECNWVRMGGNSKDQQATGLNTGYRLDGLTLAGGAQREIKADTYLGVGLSYQKTDLDSVNSDVEGERFEAGLILKRHYGQTRLSGSVSAGYGRYDSQRLVDITTPGLRALAKQDLWSVSLNGRLSHDVILGGDAYVRPMIGLGVTHVWRDAYSENGAGAVNLNVAKARDTYVSVHPAVEVGHERKLGDGDTLVRPYARLGLTHYVGGNEGNFTASLQGAPAGIGPLMVTSQADTTYTELSLGVDILKKNGFTARLDYTGQFSSTSAARALWMKLAMPF